MRHSRIYRPRPVWILGAGALVPVGGSLQQVLEQVSALQRGRLARRQLLEVGVPPRTVADLVERRRLVVLHRGVYGVAPALDVPLGTETAALLALRPGAALGAASALFAYEVIPPPDVVHVMVPGHHTGRRNGIAAHHSRTMSEEDVKIVRGLPVTRPERALLDYADTATTEQLREALDECLYRKLVSRTKVLEAVRDHGAGRAGASGLGRLIEARLPAGVSRSEGERRLRELIVSTDIPVPHMQDPIGPFRADFHWREAAYVVEFDGHDAHTLSLTNFNRDRRKSRALAARGIHVDRFTWDDVTQHQARTVAHIAMMVERRLGERRRRPAA